MIIDMIPLRDELDLLELRLHELGDVVDRFVVMQGHETFAGTAKPIHFDPAEARWSAWSGRLSTVLLPRDPGARSRWKRERETRHRMTAQLDQYQPTDVVILSDADEIPDVSVLREWIPQVSPACWFGFDTTLSYYYMNLVVPKRWACIAVAQVETARRIGMQSLRHLRKHPPMGLKTGGWHFGYLGGATGVKEKLHASAHQEFDTPQYTDLGLITRRMADKVDFYDPRTPLHEVSLGTLPVTVQRHPDRYAQYLVPSDSRARVHARPHPGVLADSVM